MRIIYAILFLLCVSGIASCEKKSVPPTLEKKSPLTQAAVIIAMKYGCEPIPDSVFYDEYSAYG